MVRRLTGLAADSLTLAAGLWLTLPVGLTAAEPSWEGKTVILTRAGIELDPRATLAYYDRANIAYGKGRYDQALADFLRPQSRTGN